MVVPMLVYLCKLYPLAPHMAFFGWRLQKDVSVVGYVSAKEKYVDDLKIIYEMVQDFWLMEACVWGSSNVTSVVGF